MVPRCIQKTSPTEKYVTSSLPHPELRLSSHCSALLIGWYAAVCISKYIKKVLHHTNLTLFIAVSVFVFNLLSCHRRTYKQEIWMFRKCLCVNCFTLAKKSDRRVQVQIIKIKQKHKTFLSILKKN